MIIYEANETDFFSNGLGTLPDATSALVTEERNGEFVLDVIYPQEGIRSELLTKNRIIKADAGHELKDQRFVIKKVTPTMDSDGYIYLTVHAEHVSYITADLGVTPNLTLSGNATQALEQWQANLVGGHPDITVDSDIISEHETNLDITKATNARQVLGGVEGSILDTWGGEYKFDNLHISLRGQRGTTANTLISYGRNLLTFEQEDDITDTYTSIYPYANVGLADGNNSKLITVDGYFVDSQYVDRYHNRKLLPVDFGSEFTDYKIGSKPSESDTGIYTTEAEIKKKLTELAKQYIENNRIGIPKVSTKITFADLSKTSEYAPLEQVNLCDIIPIRFEKLGIDTTIKVARVVWNVLLDEYDSIELGDLRTTLGESISALESKTTGLASAVITAQSTADNQNSIFRTNGGTAEPVAKKTGDLWFKTDGDYQYMYQWDGAVWHEVVNTKTTDDIANQVDQARVKMEELVKKANNDTTIFRTEGQETAPVAKKKGDLWFKTDNGQTVMHEWDGQKWHEIVSTKTTEDITKQVEQAQADLAQVRADANRISETQTESAKRLDEQMKALQAKTSDNATNVQNVIRDVAQAHADYVNQQADISKQKADLEKTQQDLLANSESIEDFKGKVSKFQVDLDGINSQVVSNTGAINQFKVTENEINQAMKDAQGNIETLKLTAKGFEQQFADTNGNIAIVKRNAAELSEQLASKVGNTEYQSFKTQTAKELSQKLVRTDLNGYATTAEVKLTTDGLKEQYTQLNGKIDGIVVGGKNLLDNSDGQLVMGWGIDNTTWTNGKAMLVYNHDYSKTNKSAEILPRSGSRNLWYRVNKDEELTQSIIVETDATYNPNGIYRFSWFTTEFNNRTVTANVDVLGTNKYRLWCSFKWDKDQSCNMRIFDIYNLTNVLQINTSGTYISFYHPQIERGNKPSDWGMSDNDINKKISDVSGDLTNYKAVVERDYAKNSSVYTKNEVVNLTNNSRDSAVNAIKNDTNWKGLININTNSAFLQTSDGFAQEVVKKATPMIGGGKNLARGTSDSWQGVDITEFSGTTNFTKNVADVYLDDLSVGDKVTVQIIYQYSGLTATNATCYLQGRGDVTGWTSGTFYMSPVVMMQTGTDLKSGSAKYTFDITADMKKNRFWSVIYRFNNVNRGAWFQWTKFKVEKGTVATPWTPAPEDLATVVSVNKVIDTADSHTRTINDYLTGSNSRFTQLSNNVNLKVNKGDVIGQINIEAGKTLLQNKKIYLDADTVAFSGKAFIPSAVITSLDAGKITTGTLNADKLNVINLNANSINAGTLSGAYLHITKDSYIDNASIDGAKIKSLDAAKITTGTLNAANLNVINLNANSINTGILSGNNLSLNLDDGTVSFKKGKIVSSNNKLILNIDDGSLAVGDASQRQGIIFNQGKMYLYDQGYFGNSTWNGNVYDWMLEMKKHPYAVLEYSSSLQGASGSLFGESGANFHSTSGVGMAYDKSILQSASVGGGLFDDWNPMNGHGVFINENGLAMGAEDKLVSIVGGTGFNYGQYDFWTKKSTILVGTNLWTDNVYDNGYNVNKMLSDGPNIYMQASALITDTAAALFRVENGDVEFAIKGNNKNVIINASGHTNNGLIVKGSQNITNWLGCQDLTVRGAKNAVVQTTAGWTKINAYETAEYYFGDLGTAITDDTSTVRIGIEPLFNETVNTDIPYQVFITAYGEGYAWVAERGSNYFVIKSSVPNLEIGYEIKAKRKGYENVRLEIDEHMEVNK